ncbi:MAG: hypothetical protein GXO23_03020 [Crenarchaeota archaeon]|nr:hypothetical protein [Thermoproteota archaeon]
MSDIKRIVAPVVAGIVVAIVLVVLVQSTLLSSKPIATKWKVRTELPVERFYNTMTSILDQEPLKCEINAKGDDNIVLIVPASYSYAVYRTMGELYAALNMTYDKVGKIIIIPYTITFNVTMPSAAALSVLNSTLRLVQYCRLHGYSRFLKLLTLNTTELKRALENVTVNIPANSTRKVFSLSLTLARAAAIEGLLQKLQYYTFVSQMAPVFIVCNTHKHICIAATLGKLNIVITNMRTQIPYGLK